MGSLKDNDRFIVGYSIPVNIQIFGTWLPGIQIENLKRLD
jgi:hypothetical protein